MNPPDTQGSSASPDWIVSTFAAGAVRTVTPENQGKFTAIWNGLDDNYMACRVDGTQPVNLQAGWNELLVRFDFYLPNRPTMAWPMASPTSM